MQSDHITSPLLKASMSDTGVELGAVDVSREAESHPLVAKKPTRPEEPPALIDHDKEKLPILERCRPVLFGHEFYWTEQVVVLLFLTVLILSLIKNFGNSNLSDASMFWIICVVASVLGNVFLWNIGWVQSDAEYSRRIATACKDMEMENEFMSNELAKLTGKVKEQTALTIAAAKQTMAMGKRVGVIDSSGKVVTSALADMETYMNSPLIGAYHKRERRVQEVMNEVNFGSNRDNAYHDIISTFKAASKAGMSDSASIELKDKKRLSKLNREIKKYNKECSKFSSQEIDMTKVYESDKDGDNVLAIWEFCEHIYHNIIQRELGAEPRLISEMARNTTEMKTRISQIDQTLGGELPMEELDEFELNTECMAFSKPPGAD